MVGEVMKHVKNYFSTQSHHGTFTIEDGQIILPFATDGQYLLIEGTRLNGNMKVIQYPSYDLKDETFEGFITELNPDEEFLKLCEDIETWCEKNSDVGVFESESFDGYSYKRATNQDGSFQSWRDIFRSRLNTWRRI